MQRKRSNNNLMFSIVSALLVANASAGQRELYRVREGEPPDGSLRGQRKRTSNQQISNDLTGKPRRLRNGNQISSQTMIEKVNQRVNKIAIDSFYNPAPKPNRPLVETTGKRLNNVALRLFYDEDTFAADIVNQNFQMSIDVPTRFPTPQPTQAPFTLQPTIPGATPFPTPFPTPLPTPFPTLNPTPEPTPVPTRPPTPQPTEEPTIETFCGGLLRDQRRQQLLTMVTSLSSGNQVSQGTPQFQAFEWLADTDGAVVCPSDILDVEQRYTLATLYFSTGGDQWKECSQEINSVCPTDSTRFLSSVDVCFWFGISCSQQEITGISIDNNNLVGQLPDELGLLDQLIDIDFDGNQFISGQIPGSIGTLEFLETLDLDNNKLSGTIPDSIYDANFMKALDLDNNNIVGTLSPKFADLSDLQILFLDQNAMDGPLPSEMGTMDKLRFLTLDDNNFQGTIPEEWAGMLDLRVLLINNNEGIKGTIPTFFGDLGGLQLLSFFNTNLSGPIPSELGQLTGLRNLFLHLTDLTGTMPQEICNLVKQGDTDNQNQLIQLTANCGGNNAQIQCNCCTACF